MFLSGTSPISASDYVSVCVCLCVSVCVFVSVHASKGHNFGRLLLNLGYTKILDDAFLKFQKCYYDDAKDLKAVLKVLINGSKHIMRQMPVNSEIIGNILLVKCIPNNNAGHYVAMLTAQHRVPKPAHLSNNNNS